MVAAQRHMQIHQQLNELIGSYNAEWVVSITEDDSIRVCDSLGYLITQNDHLGIVLDRAERELCHRGFKRSGRVPANPDGDALQRLEQR